jgi:hypothetical protein
MDLVRSPRRVWHADTRPPRDRRDGAPGSDNAFHPSHGTLRFRDELQDQHGEGAVKAIAACSMEMRLSVLRERAYPT